MTKIYLKKVESTEVNGVNLEKYDLIAENLPENFLGIATDINFLMQKNQFEVNSVYLKKMELGEAFKALNDLNKPIYLFKEDLENGKIIVGLTLKADSLKKIENGTLLSFYLDSRVEGLEFENPILSVFDQERKNLENVNWQNSVGERKSFYSKLENQQVKDKSPLLAEPSDLDSDGFAEAWWESLESQNQINWPDSKNLKENMFEQGFFFEIWYLLFLLPIIAFVLLLKYRQKLTRSLRMWFKQYKTEKG